MASWFLGLFKQKGALAPLHIAVAIPGQEGVQITELLLNALTDPDVRAREDESFLNRNLVAKFAGNLAQQVLCISELSYHLRFPRSILSRQQ